MSYYKFFAFVVMFVMASLLVGLRLADIISVHGKRKSPQVSAYGSVGIVVHLAYLAREGKSDERFDSNQVRALQGRRADSHRS